MKYAYDFHIHTAASPCGDDSMTPNNIVNMARLKGLDAIAITDHNSCANIKPIIHLAKDTNLTVIPGIEIETSEEIHLIALFENLNMALEIEAIVQENLPDLKNRKDIFGNQIIYNCKDEAIGEIEKLLLTATSLSIYKVVDLVKEIGGVCYPAHIDRKSYSVISNLGSMPEDLEITNVEVAKSANIEYYKDRYKHLRVIKSSDAHYLEDILERESYMDLPKNNISYWIQHLKSKKTR